MQQPRISLGALLRRELSKRDSEVAGNDKNVSGKRRKAHRNPMEKYARATNRWY